MSGFFRSFKFKIIMGVLALLLGVVLYAVTRGGSTTWLSQGFGVVFNPVRQAFTAVSDRIEQGVDTILNAQEYYNKNQELRAQIGSWIMRTPRRSWRSCGSSWVSRRSIRTLCIPHPVI